MSLRRILGRPPHRAPVRAVASVMLLVAVGLAMNVVRIWPASPPSAAPPSSAIAQSDPSPPPPAAYLPRLDAAPPPDLAVEGQVGGATWAVAARGDTAYVGVGPRIVAWDLRPTDRGAAPAELAKSAVLGRAVRDLVLDGDRLYAALGGAGIAVFDVADPAHIALTTERDLPGESGSLVLDGGRLYVALGRRGIVVLDAASPALDQLGAWQAPPDGDDPAKVFDIAPSGPLAYAAVDEHGLLVLDVADPTRIRAVGEVEALGEARRVTRVGQTAWVAADNGEVHVFDLRDPVRPRKFAQPDTAYGSGGEDSVAGFALSGARLAISGGLLDVWDVADPFVPRRLGSDSLRANHPHDAGNGAAFAGDRLVVAGGAEGEVTVVAIRADGAPHVTASVAGLSSVWRSFLAGAPDGRTLLSADNRIDVDRPGDPRVAGPGPIGRIVDMAGIEPFLLAPAAVVTDGPLAFAVFGDDRAQLQAYDISDPVAPRPLGAIDDRAADQDWGSGIVFSGWGASCLAVAGDRIVLGCRGALAVVDAADPLALRLLAVRGVALSDGVHAPAPAPGANYTAVALSLNGRTAVGVDAGRNGTFFDDDGGGIQAVDLADPSNPRFGPHVATPFQQRDVAIHGHHAYVAAGKGGLRVYDIADVDTVREVGAWDEGDEQAVAIAMAWPHVLLARSKRLDLIDVRDPGHPTRLASVSVPGVVKALRLYRGRAWVLTEDAGLVGYSFRGIGP